MSAASSSSSVSPVVIVAGDALAGDGSPPQWAANRLVEVLEASGATASRARSDDLVSPESFRVVVADPGSGPTRDRDGIEVTGPESFSLVRPGGAAGPVVVAGGDERGLTYGLLELADRVACSTDPVGALRAVEAISQRSVTPVRSVLRTFACEVEDKPWFYDRQFWTEYLTELATHRINRFQLALGMQYNYPGNRVTDNYFCFPYPYLLRVPGYDVSAGQITNAERDRNLDMLRFVSDETVRRGMSFQLGLWNHAYDQDETSTPHYPITGLTPDTHADYCATALAQLLRACPAIDGLSLRVHHEGGIPDPDRAGFWGPVMNAVAGVGRPIELDMHAKGVDREMLDIARRSGMPVVLGAKYWAEHQGLPYHQTTIRDKEKATEGAGTGVSAITSFQRRFTRYGYGDFLKENRDYDLLFRVWPGTQRVLLWGDPALAAGYGRLGTLGDALGVELCEPLTFKGRMDTGEPGGRDPYADPALQLGVATWKKYRYTYRLWGRLLYDPDADPETWRRFLRAEFGGAGAPIETALGAASRILPLVTVVHGLSGSNNRYWPEIYLNMPIVGGPNAHYYERDTAQPPTFGGVSSFDPSLFYSINDFADDLLAGRRDGRNSPEDTAGWLDDLAAAAEASLQSATTQVPDVQDPTFRRTAIDIAVQAGLGRFFAGKTRAGLAYALFERTKDAAHLTDAVTAYRTARDAYATVAEITTGVYRADLTFGQGASGHGHWAQRLPDIDADLADLERRLAETPTNVPANAVRIPDIPKTDRPRYEHTPPPPFTPGQEITLEFVTSEAAIVRVDLHYRHLNQGEDYQHRTMSHDGDRYSVAIPAAYTDSPYPLSYYFTIHHTTGNAWLIPGLDTDLANQPYHVIRQAGHSRTSSPRKAEHHETDTVT